MIQEYEIEKTSDRMSRGDCAKASQIITELFFSDKTCETATEEELQDLFHRVKNLECSYEICGRIYDNVSKETPQIDNFESETDSFTEISAKNFRSHTELPAISSIILFMMILIQFFVR